MNYVRDSFCFFLSEPSILLIEMFFTVTQIDFDFLPEILKNFTGSHLSVTSNQGGYQTVLHRIQNGMVGCCIIHLWPNSSQ